MTDNVWLLGLRYSSLRVALFALPFLILLFTPLPKLVDVAIALVLSAVVSALVGRGLRDRMAAAWQHRSSTASR